MKKLINHPDQVVGEVLDGFVAAYPALKRLPGNRVVVRAEKTPKVAVLHGFTRKRNCRLEPRWRSF